MNAPTVIAPLQRWTAKTGGAQADEDLVASEVPVALSYNRQPHVVMMATPRDLEDFALGFSVTEGLLRGAEDMISCRVIPRDQGLEVAMTVSEEAADRIATQRRNLTGRTGCGLCGAERLEQAIRMPPVLKRTFETDHESLQRAVAQLISHQPLQAATGAIHAAAWCSAGGEILLAKEDVGRHNALDKLIGSLTRTDALQNPGFLLVSSRASYEMVQKAATVGMELLMAVSAPTSLAIEMARQCDLTLVGFAREGRHNIYSAPERIINEGNATHE